ncbi:MAG: hypothetical protein ACOYK8_05400 [Alphaproteobacteria bacterium]
MLSAYRNGVPAASIAETLTTLLDFLEIFASPELLNAVQEITASWRGGQGLIAQLKTVNQTELNKIFGQAAPSDVRASLQRSFLNNGTAISSGEKEASIADNEELFQAQQRQMIADLNYYHPPKILPILKELKPFLEFQAYRATLAGHHHNLVHLLIAEINKFEGFEGSSAFSDTRLHHAVKKAIAQTHHHPAEKFALATGEIRADIYNSVNITYNWLENHWLPFEKDYVQARLMIPMDDGIKQHYKKLQQFKLTIEEGLKRGDINNADTKIELGSNYDRDCVVVTMRLQDYVHRYIAIKTGNYPINLERCDHREAIAPPVIVDMFKGYTPEKICFYGPEGLYMQQSALQKHATTQRSLKWLKETGFIQEKIQQLPETSSNNKPTYLLLSLKELPWQNHKAPQFYVVDGKKYNLHAMHHQLSYEFNRLYELLNAEDAPIIYPDNHYHFTYHHP